jgi:hypothetical protein
MAVDLDGNVRMRGDTGPGVGVRVLAGEGRLRLLSGNELVGDWMLSDIGVVALQEGFNLKAEGEEFVLRTEDDVALAEEIGIAAASPRLARRLAARHNPDEPVEVTEEPRIPTNLAAVGFAIAGALIVLGGVILDMAGGDADQAAPLEPDGGTSFVFWLTFVIGGALMIAIAYFMSIGTRFARIVAIVVLAGMVVVFGFAVSEATADPNNLTAYGFIGGGLVLGVAVLSSASLGQTD